MRALLHACIEHTVAIGAPTAAREQICVCKRVLRADKCTCDTFKAASEVAIAECIDDWIERRVAITEEEEYCSHRLIPVRVQHRRV